MRMAEPLETAAYTVSGALGAYASSTRVPVIPVAFCHVTPPSIDRCATPLFSPEIIRFGSVGWNTTCSVRVVVRRDHVAPASVLRQIPDSVAATSIWLFPGWIAIRFTNSQSGVAVAG